MKPGKPTTFASMPKRPAPESPPSDPAPRCLFFGLPGNPVSCLVTLSLLVLPAVRCLRGLPAAQCLHTEARARLVGPKDLKLDPERFEYHRYSPLLSFGNRSIHKHANNVSLLYIYIAPPPPSAPYLRGIAEFHMERSGGWLQVRSTGEQRSSRLLSMRSANALIVLVRRCNIMHNIMTRCLTRCVHPSHAAPASGQRRGTRGELCHGAAHRARATPGLRSDLQRTPPGRGSDMQPLLRHRLLVDLVAGAACGVRVGHCPRPAYLRASIRARPYPCGCSHGYSHRGSEAEGGRPCCSACGEETFPGGLAHYKRPGKTYSNSCQIVLACIVTCF